MAVARPAAPAVGDRAPRLQLRTLAGDRWEPVAGRPTVLVFHRHLA